MLAKLSALMSNKVALAALGGVLVVGGVGTVVAAETGHLPSGLSIGGAGATHHQDTNGQGDQNSDTNGTDGNHAHTVAIQGTLTAYSASAHTITVTGKAEDQDNSNAGTNGDKGSGKGKGTPAAHRTPTSITTCSLKSPFSVALNGNTDVNGQAKTESDLAKHINSTVEVQANENASCTLTASKVTVGGAESADPHS